MSVIFYCVLYVYFQPVNLYKIILLRYNQFTTTPYHCRVDIMTFLDEEIQRQDQKKHSQIKSESVFFMSNIFILEKIEN